MKFNKKLNAFFREIKIPFLLLFIFSINLFGQTLSKMPSDFSILKKTSAEELQLKMQGHEDLWGISRIKRWDMLQGEGTLVFTLADGLKAAAPAQIIGTYNKKDETWLWAWANTSINESLKKDARKVRAYGEKHQIEQLTKQKWTGTEEDAWAMTAVAAKLCGAQGAYRGPASDTLFVFMTFGEVNLSNGNQNTTDKP